MILAHFIGGNQSDHGIPYAEEDYFELADWTGRETQTPSSLMKKEPFVVIVFGFPGFPYLSFSNLNSLCSKSLQLLEAAKCHNL